MAEEASPGSWGWGLQPWDRSGNAAHSSVFITSNESLQRLGSDPGSLHLKRSNREVLISCSCGIFLLNLLVLFFQCLMLSSTTILLIKCQRFSAKGSISLIMCYFATDCTGNRLYRKANASNLSPVAE